MKMLRKLLLPFSILYGLIVWLRNKLYDWEIKKSVKFNVPVICVGNLSVGGTGKSPMIEFLIRLLKDEKKLATLSRGYKRESKGFYLLKENEKAAYVGDEPLQFKTKFPMIQVAVDEQRVRGVSNLLQLKNAPQVILLDDAFQHRKITPSFSILLTPFHDLFINDFILPAGNLREPRSGAERAEVIVVTKCPKNTSLEQMEKIAERLKKNVALPVYFSGITYGNLIFNSENTKKSLKELKSFTLVTGIANPKPLLEYLKNEGLVFEHIAFPDHYNFKDQDIEKLKKNDLILTTEKDFMRLKNRIPAKKLFYLPIEIKILHNAVTFKKLIKSQI